MAAGSSVNTNPVLTPPPQLSAQMHNIGNGIHDTLHQISVWEVVAIVAIAVFLIATVWVVVDSLKR